MVVPNGGYLSANLLFGRSDLAFSVIAIIIVSVNRNHRRCHIRFVHRAFRFFTDFYLNRKKFFAKIRVAAFENRDVFVRIDKIKTGIVISAFTVFIDSVENKFFAGAVNNKVSSEEGKFSAFVAYLNGLSGKRLIKNSAFGTPDKMLSVEGGTKNFIGN